MRRTLGLIATILIIALLSLPSLSQKSTAAGETVSVWMTTQDRTRLLQQQGNAVFGPDSGTATTIDINENITYQQVDGFGASLTDSSAWLIWNRMSAAQRDTLLNQLFSPTTGIGLNFLRQTIGASDFSAGGNYNYDNTCCDVNDFSINYELAYNIPLLKQIKQINPSLLIMATPWSPPGWMKTSGNMIGGRLAAAHYGNYSQYFVKFIQAYQAQGLPIYAVTPQNEPQFEPPGYPGMLMDPAEQANFIKNNLGPALRGAGLSTKIMVFDHNWDIASYATNVMNDAAAKGYVAGSALHCYGGNISAQTTVHNAHPDKDLWLTECSDGTWIDNGSFAGLFRRHMSELTIANFRNWSKGLIKWNLALDQANGPVNGGCTTCFGTVQINNTNGAVTFMPEYYGLGHASKFVKQGARRIESNSFTGGIENVAFKNPDGGKVLIAYNAGAASATFKVRWAGQSFSYTLPAGAAATFTWAGTGGAGPVLSRTGWVASASNSPSDPCCTGDVPANALDGNAATRWTSGLAQANGQWFQVDMTGARTFSQITLDSGVSVSDYPVGYQVFVSNDGVNWGGAVASGAGNTPYITINFPAQTARYIRIVQTGSSGSWWSLHELNVYGSVVVPTATRTNTTNPSCGSANAALNRPAISSSNESASYTPNLAVDGNTTTRWASAFSDPQWIYVDLGSSQSICRVRLNWEAAYSTAYQVQTSNDAAAWSTIYSTTAGDGGIDDLSVSGSGRYVRVNGTARGTAYGHSLWELEVYLGNSPTATRTRTNTTVVASPTRTRTNTTGGPTATRTRTNTTSSGTPAWAPNTAYAVGATVSYGGLNYRCAQAHTSQVGWEPPNTPALWQRI